jgi:hypothetical protein
VSILCQGYPLKLDCAEITKELIYYGNIMNKDLHIPLTSVVLRNSTAPTGHRFTN